MRLPGFQLPILPARQTEQPPHVSFTQAHPFTVSGQVLDEDGKHWATLELYGDMRTTLAGCAAC